MNISAIQETAAQHKPTILVVDDMEANRAVLVRRLERYDYAVTSVASGRAALEVVEHSVPDIILLDYMMPDMNGIEVLKKLRTSAATQEIPVIMVTARAEGEATVEALDAGADDYVTKPIDFEVLRARIVAHLSKRTNASDLHRANAALDERVTRRSLALADLESELSEEIDRRKALEARVAELTGGAADASAPARSSPDLSQSLGTAIERFDFVFEIISSGRAPNLAQMAELRSVLVKAHDASRLVKQDA